MKLLDAPCGPPKPQLLHSTSPPRRPALPFIAFLLILLLAASVRIFPTEASKGPGYDELLYRGFVLMIDRIGFANYAAISAFYRQDQRNPQEQAKLPPTRFSYIAAGWLCKRLCFGDAPPGNIAPHGGRSGDPALIALCRVSWLGSIALVALVGIAAWRMFGAWSGVGAMALAAVSPVPIHLARGAFIDGYFAAWATLCLWLLWENLQKPNHLPRLVAFGLALAVMVATKENAFFIFLGLCGLTCINRWAKFGVVTPRLVVVGIFGPTLGFALLIVLAGGLDGFIEIYRLLVAKAQNLPYAVWSGDGPWYRYLIDLLTVDPLVLVLAVSGVFTLPREHKSYRFLLFFVLFSYAAMCNVRYGMNLRYATVWLLPLCAFASAQLHTLAKYTGRRSIFATTALFTLLCAYEVRQYRIFFVEHSIYELVPEGMFRAVNIIKDPPKDSGW
jgi:hypothetical protein